MKKSNWLMVPLCTLFLASAVVFGAEDDAAEVADFDAGVAATLTEKLASSMVTVNYYLKADAMGAYPMLEYWCPICESNHMHEGSEMVAQAKPISTFGLIVGDGFAVAPDIELPTENIDRIEIDNQHGKNVNAVLDGYFPGRLMVKLIFSGDIDTTPLNFVPDASGDLYSFIMSDADGATAVKVSPFAVGTLVRDVVGERDYFEMPESTLIVDGAGGVAGIAFSDLVPADESWRMPVAEWDFVSTVDREAEKENLKNILNNGVFSVKFKLAEPPKSNSAAGRYDEPQLEFFAPGILRKDGTLLVPLALSAQNAGRIERITMLANGDAVLCDFVGAVKYFDAFVVRPTALPDSAAAIDDLAADNMDFYSNVAWEVVSSVSDKGINFQLLPLSADFRDIVRGYGNVRYPDLSVLAGLVFSRSGTLVTAPLSVRAAGIRRRYSDDKEIYDVPLLNDARFAEFDPAFAPKSEAERFMLGWLGVDYQIMNSELAEANDVLHLTNNGELGLLVTDVAADSPADRAGIVSGNILLRVTPLSGGAPMELSGGEYRIPDMSSFPWSRYDELPEMYFDMIPFPWPDMNSGINKVLTSFGIGAEYDLAYVADGEVRTARLKVEPAPECFYNAKRYNAQSLGVTVCGITPEVRRYMLMIPDDPGVLIAGVKAGSKASVAGIKPYEIICRVDGAPVSNIDEFKEAVEGKANLKLEVKRLSTSRIVSVKLDTEKESGEDASGESEAEQALDTTE